MSKEAMKLALDLATMHHTDESYDELRSKMRVAAKEELSKQEQEVPEGYKLVMVPNESPTNEPDWDECIRQAEISTGLKVERHTLSIVIREVRRWLIAKQEQGEPVAQKNVCIECQNADSRGLPDKPICRKCVRNSKWQPLNASSVNPLYTTPQPKQEQGEPVAWLWKHINRDGEELNAGLSFEKVEPTNNTFWMNPNDPRLTATEVQPLYTTPQQRKPLTYEQFKATADEVFGFVVGLGGYEDAVRTLYEAAHGIKE